VCTADADCGQDASCSPTPIGPAGSPRLCFQRCYAGAAGCAGAPARVCADDLGGMLQLGQLACVPGDSTKVDGSPCDGHLGDCNAGQVCASNPFEFPGGMCLTFGCTVGDDSTCAPGGDGRCINAGGPTLCVDPCTSGAMCRTGEGYACAPLPGLGYDICYFPHAAPGAACTGDAMCGPAGSPWRCLTGAAFPGGYCSGAAGTCDPMDGNSCPFHSICHDPSPAPGNQYCVAGCMADGDCRMAEGYQCLPLDPTMPMGPRGCLRP
jgi:hypothetical protein